MLPVINALEVKKGKPAMKQNTTELEKPRRRVVRKNKQRELTIGVDLGDKTSRYCVLDREGNVLFERSTATTKKSRHSNPGASRSSLAPYHRPFRTPVFAQRSQRRAKAKRVCLICVVTWVQVSQSLGANPALVGNAA